MLFLDVPGSSTTPRPASARDSVASTDVAFPLSKQGRHAVRQLSGLNSPAHRCLCLRFALRLATHHARLEVGIESLLLFRRALSSPTTCRFIPAHLLSSRARLRFTSRAPVCGKVVLPVEDFSANGQQCLNCLCQPRGQAQRAPFHSLVRS